jgi:hypothetical protein
MLAAAPWSALQAMKRATSIGVATVFKGVAVVARAKPLGSIPGPEPTLSSLRVSRFATWFVSRSDHPSTLDVSNCLDLDDSSTFQSAPPKRQTTLGSSPGVTTILVPPLPSRSLSGARMADWIQALMREPGGMSFCHGDEAMSTLLGNIHTHK